MSQLQLIFFCLVSLKDNDDDFDSIENLQEGKTKSIFRNAYLSDQINWNKFD